jgi:hypothetical protein
MICISCGTPLEEDISCRILGGKIFRKCATIDVLYTGKSIEDHRMEIAWTFIGNRMDFDYP